MRVVHVINSLSASGGAEQGLVREITRFSSSVEQLVVRLYQPNQLEVRVVDAGIESVSLGLDSDHSGWNWPAGVSKLRRHLERLSPDVAHTSLASANLIGQLAARRSSVPVLSTFTLSGDPALMRLHQPGASSRRAQLMRRIERLAARGRQVWFRALTADAKETNVRAAGLDPDRVTVIPRGVPIPDLSMPAPSREELGLPADEAVVLNVGRQTAQKGHADLVSAFASVRATVPVHLVILGREGDGTRTLQEAIRREQMADHVTVVPYSDRPYDYYRTADVFAFPSLMEGLGTAVLEAMACVVPVIAYDIPPVREITDGGRYAKLVPVGDHDALASTLEMIVESPASVSSMIEQARENVVANYSLDSVALRMEDRLRDLAEGP
jgi:glycosyltransferase involved in cell wall biosynthesis